MRDRLVGFTLLELLLSLAIISIVFCFSMPLFRGTNLNHQVVQLQQHLIQVLKYARFQAFLRHETLLIKPISQQGLWREGAEIIDSSDQVIYKRPWQFNLDVDWHGFYDHQKITVAAEPENLSMNGYFLIKNNHTLVGKLVVNRFGQIHWLSSN
jgi:prepilin-type N-terminal cleavage/methylation domain-containing protein